MRRSFKYGLLFFPFAAFTSLLPAQEQDPPARVARLSFMDGSVSFRPDSLQDWGQASRNRPLTTGDHLWDDKDSRSEIQLGSMTIRLGPETAFAFLNLTDTVAQMQITGGSARIHVREVADGEALEVDTPNAAVSLLHPGIYRVDVDDKGNSTVTVRRGDADATAEGSEIPIHARQAGLFMGDDPPVYDIWDERAPDDWDRWCMDRERGDDPPNTGYVSTGLVGWEDLNTYGTWRDVPQYGEVWVPGGVGAGWAPYRQGHWGYVAPWGWTWIDDAPWGFAPFHYGRWASVSGQWVWTPGTIVARPVYAPALVVFAGGGGWSASLSIGGGGGVAWFPLGPQEVYYPAYHVSPTYVRTMNVTNVTNVNVINVTNVTNVNRVTYVNQSVAGAVTAVPNQTFVSAQPVAAAAVVVPPGAASSIRPAATAAPLGIQPTSQSLLSHPVVASASGAPNPVPRPPTLVASRPVVALLPPPAPPPAFGPKTTPIVATTPLIKPAIPPAGVTHLPLKPARSSLPAPVPATTFTGRGTAHSGPLQPTGSTGIPPKSTTPVSLPPTTTLSGRPFTNDRPSRALPGSLPQGNPTPKPTPQPGTPHTLTSGTSSGITATTLPKGPSPAPSPHGAFTPTRTPLTTTSTPPPSSSTGGTGGAHLTPPPPPTPRPTPTPTPPPQHHATPPPEPQTHHTPTPHPSPTPKPK